MAGPRDIAHHGRLSTPHTVDMAQAHRLHWFLAAHLLAVLLIVGASMWAVRHLATRPDALAAASPPPHREPLAATAPVPQQEHP